MSALIETDGERIAASGRPPIGPIPTPSATLLRQALGRGAALTDRTARPGVLARGRGARRRGAHGEAVETFLTDERIAPSDIDRRRLSRPDGAAPAGAAADGADRRRRGAGGAARHRRWSTISAPPTLPPAGRARRSCRSSTARCVATVDRPHPVAVLNIGGVANVTFVDGGAIRSPATPARATR